MEASRPLAPRRAPLRFDDGNARTSAIRSLDYIDSGKVHAAFADVEEREGRIVAILGAHEDVDVQARCQPDGAVSLKGLAISGFRVVHLPRVWDDSERRKAEKDPQSELDRLARTFKTTLDEWTKSVSELATWIRFSPPVAGAKPIEP